MKAFHASAHLTASAFTSALALTLLILTGCRTAAPWREPVPRTWDAVNALLAPPAYPKIPSTAVDPTTLDGKLMAGYQGWFIAHDDGSDLGWTHYGTGTPKGTPPFPKRFEPGAAAIDLWPDLSEAGGSERYPTAFHRADGSVAEVFTSRHPATIDRHFKWMEDYGIDGVFLQRFANELSNPALAAVRNQVLRGVRTSAARHGRTWSLMYDLSGLRADSVEHTIMEDWKRLVDTGDIRHDPRIQRHHGKPVVAIWGIGFNDGRRYSLAECERLVRWLKEDPVYGGNAVMIGVPYSWRTLGSDSTKDEALHRICALADIISPWAVGRMVTLADAAHTESKIAADVAWTREHHNEYLPVIYPGFSWHNLSLARGQTAAVSSIPRLNGQFYTALGDAAIRGGTRMLYVAMFDELDEGTAIMKTDNTPPTGASPFSAEPGIPSDHYLRLSGDLRTRLQRSFVQAPATTAAAP